MEPVVPSHVNPKTLREHESCLPHAIAITTGGDSLAIHRPGRSVSCPVTAARTAGGSPGFLVAALAAFLLPAHLALPAFAEAQEAKVPKTAPVGVASEEPQLPSGSDFDATPFLPYAGKTVEAIHITGNKHTKQFIITREIHTKVGQPLDIKTLAGDQLRLENIQIFSSVKIAPASGDSGVVLTFELHEMPPILVYPALSFTDQDGWSYGAGMSSMNMFGRHLSVSFKALFGGTQTLAASASNPWISGNHFSFKWTFQHLERYNTLNEFEETDNYFTPWFGTYVGEHGRAGATVSWLQVKSDSTGRTLDADDTDNFLIPGFYLTYDSRSSTREPDNGWYINWSEGYSVGLSGTPGDSWTSLIDVRKYSRTFGSQILVVGAFAEFQSGDVGVDVPEYLQFYMGGANSIRGYDLDSLGQTLYGKNQFITTIEYSFQLRPLREYKILGMSFNLGLSLALFADNGIAWSRGGDFNMDRNKLGGGIGLRLLVPGMSMVRFDFAQGEGGGFQFAFGSGTKFDAQTKRIR